ncbi:hypothetical protein [Mucilaginibacter sp. SP1R1]|uniref:hypothetical protein n=1 Tax=Mucilaginibacter sp. SP1R1 TaxID=2723091 RepID=UPI00160A99B8|nr:hypothetical protein [Mucilaginibacter sp. SP1R1]MBB6150122.1 hypothetical protein [Mucilaginibacter sp. SP1R1]
MVAKKIFYHGYMDHGLPIKLPDNSSLLTPDHVFNVIATLVVTIGLLLLAFSKEKFEDEQIIQLRLDSLQWTMYFTYLLFILIVIFTSGIDLVHIVGINLWLQLVFFIIRFRWVIFRLNQSSKAEKAVL